MLMGKHARMCRNPSSLDREVERPRFVPQYEWSTSYSLGTKVCLDRPLYAARLLFHNPDYFVSVRRGNKDGVRGCTSDTIAAYARMHAYASLHCTAAAQWFIDSQSPQLPFVSEAVSVTPESCNIFRCRHLVLRSNAKGEIVLGFPRGSALRARTWMPSLDDVRGHRSHCQIVRASSTSSVFRSTCVA